ncbi:Wall-associated kinase family protein [Rhynchospora pubera]|uniref:Wall-associated kinase family protein n=2 Tax=Rhynchospora pubera TaxID=906938 RepID=A0AAV8BUM7_9POAL|nr:Wall-associated kinase family protein [Rhynchospora pubera]
MLVLLLLLLALLCPSSSQRLDPSVFKPDAGSCYNISIPYPFGIIGNYSLGLEHLPSFGIICNGSGPMLPLPSGQYKVVDISLPQGTITILGRAVAWRCLDNFSGISLPPDQDLSLEGTPFTFSDMKNKFTLVGCDAMATIQGANGSYISGCAAFCVSKKTVVEGVCSGVGCCQAPIPRALKRLNLNFTSIRGQIGATQDVPWDPCSKAFLVKEDEYVFTYDDLISNMNNQNRTVVLEWSIGNQSCSEMDSKNGTECKANSHCYNSTNGIGYRCKCFDGFEGNPYLSPGCEDINECKGPNNPCVHPNRCKNTIGGSICKCPFGMSGDGTLRGTGCKKVELLEIILGVGLVMVLIVFALVLWTYWLLKKRRLARRKQRYFLQNGGVMLRQRISSQKALAKIFSSEELKKATNNYSEDRILGKGGYGTVYKGMLEDHTVVAIKKSKLVDETQIEQFINEVVILSQINHRNVVKLLGCCLETEVPLLVYEFIPNGNLFYHLHNDRLGSISWENRLRIAVETAIALAYLHSATQFPIIHRDVKSSNILLDENYTAKVADFGASRLVPYNQTHVTTLVQGTFGYLDPEYFQTSVLTEKSDVYSFGVVLVELLTRQKPISHDPTNDWKNLATHFITLVERNQFLEMVDQTVLKEAGATHLNVVVQIALNCLSLKREDRPKMIDVLVELNALRRLLKQHMDDHTQEHHLEFYRKEKMAYTGSSSNLIKLDEDDDSMESHLLIDRNLSSLALE